MVVQLIIGSFLMGVTSVAAAMSWWGLEVVLMRTLKWVMRPPHGRKLVMVLSCTMIWALFLMTVSVWIWAIALWALGVFADIELSVYFALVAFTTLGFGDVLLPTEWRLLGGLAAANGLLIFGLLTAMLVETLQTTRLRQRGRGNVKF